MKRTEPLLETLFNELKKEKFSFKAIARFFLKGIRYSIQTALELKELRKSFFIMASVIFIIVLLIWAIFQHFFPLKIAYKILYVEVIFCIFTFASVFFLLGLVRSEMDGEHYRKFGFPNSITIFRFLMIPYLFSGIYYSENESSLMKFTFLLFFITVITDGFDGYLSRKFNLTSDFGRIFDPVVDTFFNTILSIILYIKNFFPLWFIILVIIRYWFHVFAGAILFFFIKPITIKSTIMGKVSSFTVSVFIGLFLLKHAYSLNFLNFFLQNWFFYLGGFILFLTFFAFILKEWGFFKKFWRSL